MYFSNLNSDEILFNDPSTESFRRQPEIYSQIFLDQLLYTRVLLDTHPIKFGRLPYLPLVNPVNLVTKSRASFSLGNMRDIGPTIFITNALIKAEFREIEPKDFINRYLSPLDHAIRVKNIKLLPAVDEFQYPVGDPLTNEHVIQTELNDIIRPLRNIYGKIYQSRNISFGDVALFRPPFYRKKLIKPDVAHLYSESTNFQSPDSCFALGDLKTVAYKLAEGFEKFKIATQEYKDLLNDHTRLKPQTKAPAFDLGEWSEKAAFALVLRRYLLHSFLCGTDRVFISDYQTFSGFFQYRFIGDQMVIDYYIINDPETIDNGITLRSAIAGFFYKDITELLATKEKFALLCAKSIAIMGADPFGEKKSPAKEGGESDFYVLEEVVRENSTILYEGNTTCRVLYNAPQCYPGIGIDLPSEVFVKAYHYSSKSWEMHDLIYLDTPSKSEYYDIFFNEKKINKIIAESPYASNYPKLFASGYWNGVYDNLMHIFEYLGEELPKEKWDNYKVYTVIKSRLKELHSLGISHNDIRISNIHVSVSGKISLIDFGLSDAKNNEEHKLRDLQSLDEIFGIDNCKINEENRGHKTEGKVTNNRDYPPPFVLQNESYTNRAIVNYDSYISPSTQNEGYTDRRNENDENDPSSLNQNEDLRGVNVKKNLKPTSFHQIDPFYGKGPY